MPVKKGCIKLLQLPPVCPAWEAYSSRSVRTNNCQGKHPFNPSDNINPIKKKQQELLVSNKGNFGIAISIFMEYTANPETSLKVSRNSNENDLAIKNITLMNSSDLIIY